MGNKYAEKHWMLIFGTILIVHGVLSFLLFDPSISLMADDSNYVMGASRFIEEGIFPTAHGAYLYQLVLAIPFAIFGKSILVAKYCSIVWSTITLTLSYFTFRKIVSLWVLFGVLLIQASNFLIHFYGSSTMSESFYMMIQMIFVSVVLHFHNGLMSASHKDKHSLGNYLLICIPVVFTAFLVSITRSIGIVAPISVVIYLLIQKKWANGIVFSSLFILLKSAYAYGVKSFFGIEKLSNRMDYILLKNYYHPDQGNENFPGLIWRMWQNFTHHISSDMLRILGWRENHTFIEPIAAFSLLFLLCFILVLWWNWSRNSKMLFIGIYLSILALGTFVSLQAHWRQDRMILIIIPLILIFILDGAEKFLKERSPTKVPVIYGFLVILCFANLNHLSGAIARSRAITKEYLNGNEFFAYTPDWLNYLKAAQWAGENLPTGSIVLCRKANTASVYTEGDIKFTGRSLNTNKKGYSVLKELNENGVSHILLANLRIIPDKAVPGMVIGAIHSYVIAITQYEASALKVLYHTGNEEPAYILELDYSALNKTTN